MAGRGRPVGYTLLPKDYQEVKEKVGDHYTIPEKDYSLPVRKKREPYRKFDENGVELSLKTGKPKKKPRGKAGSPPAKYDVPEGDASRILRNIMELNYLPKPKNEEEYIERFNFYFDWCIEHDEKPTVESFCLAMNIYDGGTFDKWARGESGEFKKRLAKNAKQVIKAFMTSAVTQNKINPVVWMFYGKNYFGYSDKRELVVDTPNNSEIDEDRQQQIIDSLPDVEEAEVIE